MKLPRYLFAEDLEAQYVIRTEPPRFIARLDPDEEGEDILKPEGPGVPISVEQWIDPRPSDDTIREMLRDLAEFSFERPECVPNPE